jgi:LysM repeat protein
VSGDTFSSIAEKCGKTTQEIVDANPQLDPRGLHPGDVINIPQ